MKNFILSTNRNNLRLFIPLTIVALFALTSLLLWQTTAQTQTAEQFSINGLPTPTPTPTPVIDPTPVVCLQTVIETEPNDIAATANVLVGNRISGRIGPAGDADYYQIDNVPAGSVLFTFTDTGTGPTNITGETNSRDSTLTVVAADGTTTIEFDDDDGIGNGGDGGQETGLASVVAGRTLTAGGTYYIRVAGSTPTTIINRYNLYARFASPNATTPEIESNDTPATATALALNTIGAGSVSSVDTDYFAVALTANNVAQFYLDGDPERNAETTPNVNHQLNLIAPNGTTVLLNANSGNTLNSATNPEGEGFDYFIQTTGIYFVRVLTTSITGEGTYQLLVNQTVCVEQPTSTPTPTPTPTPGVTCNPNTTVTEGDLFPGGITSFGVSSGPGSITVDHVNAGTGLQSLTVVGGLTNANVAIPPFTPGTTAPITVTFTIPNPGFAVDFTLRAASTFHAVFIRVRCAETCTPSTTVTEGDLFPGGIVSFGITSGPGSVTVDHVNAGTGLRSLTVVGTPTNAVVMIPPFTIGTTMPVIVRFTPIDLNQPVDFTLRAASTFHAANIRVRCGTLPPRPEQK